VICQITLLLRPSVIAKNDEKFPSHDPVLSVQFLNSSGNVVSNTGFWKVRVNLTLNNRAPGNFSSFLAITDGLSSKVIWQITENTGGSGQGLGSIGDEVVVFLRAGDTLTAQAGTDQTMDVSYRQIADVNGNLVNPLGFTFS